MNGTRNLYLAFLLETRRFAVRLSAVERVERAVEITPLPKAPGIVLGIINMSGRVVPVLDIRTRFGLPCLEVRPSDQFLVARTSRRSAALVVDSVTGLVDAGEEEIVPAGSVARGMEYVEGVIKLPDGMVLIHDLDAFLSLEEEASLDSALRANTEEGESGPDPARGPPAP